METVWADVPEDEKPGLDRRTFEATFREYAAEFVEGRRAERFVAEDDAGRFLGYIILGELKPFFSPRSVGFVYDIWVSPEHRRAGVARFLLGEAERWARSRGYAKIKLEVAEPNRGARALYGKVGYAPERIYMGKRLA
jgi:ribosomal protein S18 acetylase RimI-like enzyme